MLKRAKLIIKGSFLRRDVLAHKLYQEQDLFILLQLASVLLQQRDAVMIHYLRFSIIFSASLASWSCWFYDLSLWRLVEVDKGKTDACVKVMQSYLQEICTIVYHACFIFVTIKIFANWVERNSYIMVHSTHANIMDPWGLSQDALMDI